MVKMSHRKRNWTEYNERLVKRGEYYISLDFLENWDHEVSRLNKGKRGRPFEYPEQFILFMAIIHISFYLPYRQLEGFTRKLAEYIPEMSSADYTTLFRRMKSLDIDITDTVPSSSKNRIVAVDSTGIKVSSRGEWIRHKWKVHRGWLKVHVMVDVETKEVISLEVTTEKVSDNQKFESLLNSAEANGNNISEVLADGAYDTRAIHTIIGERGIKSGIKIRKGSSTRSRGSPHRAKHVREVYDIGIDEWKKKHGYGRRWSVEGVFSVVKRAFGEGVRASSMEGMIREVKMKFILYNMLINFMG